MIRDKLVELYIGKKEILILDKKKFLWASSPTKITIHLEVTIATNSVLLHDK